MLTYLEVENFRAFKHAGVSLSKLNIFVGPNNSGKSSIISAINLIAQNIRPANQEVSLALNGPYTQLGTYYDVVHGHSSRSRVNISFEINKFRYEYRFRYRPQKREIELVRCEISDGDTSYLMSKQSDVITHKFSSKDFSAREVPARMRARFYGLYAILSFPFSDPEQNEEHEYWRRIRDFAFRSMRAFDQHFASFDSVGAFRAAPERTYHYTGEAPSNVGRYGENFAQMLANSAASRSRSASNIIRQVASWFDIAGVARDVRIKPLTNRHFEILVEDNTGSKNNITDSGFGCSQVLPVLVGGYTLLRDNRRPAPSVFVVQEPEIHLHPTAAAHLGSYFVQLATNNVQCFIETHSENIILRVARHVALKDLSPSDVRIYWVDGDGKEHTATLLELNDDGTFKTEWPAGFFPTRATETLQLARAASGILAPVKSDGEASS